MRLKLFIAALALSALGALAQLLSGPGFIGQAGRPTQAAGDVAITQAIRLDASGKYLKRTATSPGTANLTFMGYFRFLSFAALPDGVGILWDQGTGPTLDMFYDNANVYVAHSDGSNTEFAMNAGWVTNVWHHVAIVISNTVSVYLYTNGVLHGSSPRTLDGSTPSGTALRSAIWSDDSQLDALFDSQAMKLWETNLTAAEVASELGHWRPVKSVAHWATWPLAEDVEDKSGNSRDWTATGSPGFTSGQSIDP